LGSALQRALSIPGGQGQTFAKERPKPNVNEVFQARAHTHTHEVGNVYGFLFSTNWICAPVYVFFFV
jgi:hypothetical protein